MYKVQVRKDDFSDSVSVWIGIDRGDSIMLVKPVELTFEDYDRAGVAEPTLHLPLQLGEDLVRAFTDAGVKP